MVLISPQATDVSQHRRVYRRRRGEKILAVTGHLDPADRRFIELLYLHGVSMTELAQLVGLPRSMVVRRVRKILLNIRKPLFRFVAIHLDLFDEPVRRTARLVVLRGWSMRRVASHTGLSLYTVREHMRTVRAVARC